MELIKKNGKWNPTLLPRENGEDGYDADTPNSILLVEVRTYLHSILTWFFNRLDNGYCHWTNPFNACAELCLFSGYFALSCFGLKILNLFFLILIGLEEKKDWLLYTIYFE